MAKPDERRGQADAGLARDMLRGMRHDLGVLADRVERGVAPAVDAMSGRLAAIEAAVAHLIRLEPRGEGNHPALASYLGDVLEGIEHRMGGIERMGREDFELDQRLHLLEDAVNAMVGPFKELEPQLRHVADMSAWLGRMEERLHSFAVQIGPLVDSGSRTSELRAQLDRLEEGLSAISSSVSRDVQTGPADDVATAPADGLDVGEALDALAPRLDAIEAAVAGLDIPPAPDLAELHQLTPRLDAIEAAVAALAALVERPAADPGAGDLEAVAAEAAAAVAARVQEGLGRMVDALVGLSGDTRHRLELLAAGATESAVLADERLGQVEEAVLSLAERMLEPAPPPPPVADPAMAGRLDALQVLIAETGRSVAAIVEQVDELARHAGPLLDERLRPLAEGLVELTTAASAPAPPLPDLAGILTAALQPLIATLDELAARVHGLPGPAEVEAAVAQAMAGRLDDAEQRAADEQQALQATLGAVEQEVAGSAGQRVALQATLDSLPALLGSAEQRAADEQQALREALVSVEQEVAGSAGQRAALQATLDSLPALLGSAAETSLAAVEPALAHQHLALGELRDAVRALHEQAADSQRLDAVIEAVSRAVGEAEASIGERMAAVVTRLSSLEVTAAQAVEAERSALVATAVAGLTDGLHALQADVAHQGASIDGAAAQTALAASATAASAADVAARLEAVDDALAQLRQAVERPLPTTPLVAPFSIAALEDAVREVRRDAGMVPGLREAVERLRTDVVALRGRRADDDASARITATLRELTASVELSSERVVELDRRIGAVRTDVGQVAASSGAVHHVLDAVQALAAGLASLERRMDADGDELGRRVDSLTSVVGATLDERQVAEQRDRASAQVADRLGRLRDVAAGVGDAARSELRRRRTREDPRDRHDGDGPRGLGPGTRDTDAGAAPDAGHDGADKGGRPRPWA